MFIIAAIVLVLIFILCSKMMGSVKRSNLYHSPIELHKVMVVLSQLDSLGPVLPFQGANF